MFPTSITTKQLLYLVGLQRTEREQKMVRDYLKQLGKTTLDELIKEEASELIGRLKEVSLARYIILRNQIIEA